jgi:cytochrome d ubiquinol oxidase subunit I
VYAAGVTYLLGLMAQAPHPGEAGPPREMPTRAAGITPVIEGANQ